MWVYIILYVLTIFFCFAETNRKTIKIHTKTIKVADLSFFILGTYILLLGMLRGELLGSDSINYKYNCWEVYKALPFRDMIHYSDDWGYSLFNWLAGRFVSEFWAFRAILFAVTFLSVAVWIKKHSCNISVSFFVFLSLGFLGFEFTTLRQALAVSIFIWSYDFLIEKKPVKFVLVILLAATCHKTALFLLIEYPLLTTKVKNGKRLIRSCYLAGAVGMALFVEKWVSLVYRHDDYRSNLGAGGERLLLYYIFLFLLLHFFIRKCRNTERIEKERQLAISSIYIQIIATAVSNATRVLKYTTTYLFVLIPHMMDELDRKTRNTLLFLLVGFLSILYIREFGSGEIVPYTTWLNEVR